MLYSPLSSFELLHYFLKCVAFLFLIFLAPISTIGTTYWTIIFLFLWEKFFSFFDFKISFTIITKNYKFFVSTISLISSFTIWCLFWQDALQYLFFTGFPQFKHLFIFILVLLYLYKNSKTENYFELFCSAGGIRTTATLRLWVSRADHCSTAQYILFYH